MKNLILIIAFFAQACFAISSDQRVMAPGMWHKISNGDPIVDSKITEGAYIVLDDDHNGKASFQLALIPGEDVLKSLTAFQKTTGITSGKGVAVFNIEDIELDQWIKPSLNRGVNHAPDRVEKSREGLMVCLFSGAIKGDSTGAVPPPHCHAMVAGYDDVSIDSHLTGGYPATGGHLGGAKVHVVLEMHVDSYPEVLEKGSGGELCCLILSISDKQASAARDLLSKLANSKK
jgi:predicted DNA-binding protein with PD1-like motif